MPLPSTERLRNLTREMEKSCCYQKPGPSVRAELPPPLQPVVPLSDSTERGSANLMRLDPALAQSPEISASKASGKAAAGTAAELPCEAATFCISSPQRGRMPVQWGTREASTKTGSWGGFKAILNHSFSSWHRIPCPLSNRNMPFGVSPPCWKLLVLPTSMGPSW